MKNQNWLANLTEEIYNDIHDFLFDKLYTELYQGAYTAGSLPSDFRDAIYEDLYKEKFSQLYNESPDMSYETFCDALYCRIYLGYGKEVYDRTLAKLEYEKKKYSNN